MGFTSQNFRISTRSIFTPYVALGVTKLEPFQFYNPPDAIPRCLADHAPLEAVEVFYASLYEEVNNPA